MSDPNKASTYGEVAKHFGVSRDTVRQYWVARGMPGERGDYNLAEIAAWKAITIRDPSSSGDSLGLDEIDDGDDCPTEIAVKRAKANRIIADADKARSDADLKKLELRKQSENLVPLEIVENYLAELFTATRRAFSRIGLEMKDGYPVDLQERIKADCDRRVDMALRTMEGHAARLAEIKEDK